ncbi:unnamed protein product, partial [Lampetra planeri]
ALLLWLKKTERKKKGNMMRELTKVFPDKRSLAEVSRMLESLTGQHLCFQQCLLDSEAMLRRQKEHFRSGLLHSADEFKRRVQSLVDDFHTHGPFGSAVSCDDALGQVSNLRGQLNGLKLEESDLRRGLGIFKMEQSPNKEMQALDK